MAWRLLHFLGVTRDEKLQFERTARELQGELYRKATRLCGRSRADDLVQETFVRALAAWHRFTPGENPRAWMHTILRNTFLNQLRKARRESELAREPADRDRTLDRILAMDLRRALGELSPELRGTLVLVDGEGYAYREAAARLGTRLGTVMSRLHRARARMVALLSA